MTVTVVGSVAFDSLETPFGRRERILGGAATHFSLAASMFTDVRVVGVVGDDFGSDELDRFHAKGIDTTDVERVAGARSFFWEGRYDNDMQVAHTIETQLNVFADFDPKLSDASRNASMVFLANIQPDLQRGVREQCGEARITGLDSMNYWIESARESLLATLSGVDVVMLNDAEVRMLTGEANLKTAAAQLRGHGPRVLVIKQGSYGACMCTDEGFFFVPGHAARPGRRSDRRGRRLRRRLLRLPRQPRRRPVRRGQPAPRRGLRIGHGVVRDRGLRQRAARARDPLRGRRPLRASSSA